MITDKLIIIGSGDYNKKHYYVLINNKGHMFRTLYSMDKKNKYLESDNIIFCQCLSYFLNRDIKLMEEIK